MSRILVIEDDASIVAGLTAALRGEGYDVHSARDGIRGLEAARRGDAQLIILDVMLPGMSGFEIAKRLRDDGSRVPIIVLTAKGDEDDRVLGLELGADDYIAKPFSVREVLARVRSVLRRAGAGHSTSLCRFGDVEVDLKAQRVRKAGKPVEFSAREFRLLRYFIEHEGEMVSREQLLNDIWGYEIYPTTRTVDNHVARLRKKIEDQPDTPRYLLTARGAGYRFESNPGDD